MIYSKNVLINVENIQILNKNSLLTIFLMIIFKNFNNNSYLDFLNFTEL